jgi:hypothetical protein
MPSVKFITHLHRSYWIDELDNWSFLEYWVSAKAIAWSPLPEPFARGVLGYNRKEPAAK